MLLGKPVFPGSSTMNQLDKIMELTGRPSDADLAAVNSPYGATMMESMSASEHPKDLRQVGGRVRGGGARGQEVGEQVELNLRL